REVRVLEGHRGPVNALAPLEGGWLASGGEGGTVRIWEVETGKLAFAALVLTGELAPVEVRLDKDGVTLCAPAGSRPWRARTVGEARLPADSLLHEAARFLYRSFALPLYRFPERFEWVGPEDEDKDEKTRCIRLKWPNVSGFEWQKQVF
ncbi:WD40 repeat domain-containing protein, partial [Oceanithermus sp.]